MTNQILIKLLRSFQEIEDGKSLNKLTYPYSSLGAYQRELWESGYLNLGSSVAKCRLTQKGKEIVKQKEEKK